MKKSILFGLCLMMFAGLFACQQQAAPAEAPAEAAAYTTLADVFALSDGLGMYSMDSQWFVHAFEVEGDTWRIVAPMSEELYDKVDAIDFFDETWEEQIKALIADLPIVEISNLSQNMPTEAELAAYVGKTGEELLSLGFYPGGYMITDEATVFYMGQGDFEYMVTFNESLDPEEDFDQEEAIKPLTVKDIVCTGIGGSALDYVPES